MAIMRSGFDEAKKAVERSKQGFAPPAGKLNYLSMKAGDIIYVRFIDDAIITAKFYEWIINNQGQANSEFIAAPDLYQYDPDWRGEDWVKKYTSPTPGIGWCKKFKSDEIIEPKLKEKTVGMCVLREPVLGEDGIPLKPLQFQDALETIDGDDGEHVALHFMLVRQALSNFWDQMVGFHGLYGTICDRDYRIERKGGDQKTTYQAIPMKEDPDWNYDGSSLAKLQALYGYGVKLTKDEGVTSRPEHPAFAETTYSWDNRYLYAPTTVAEWCERRASEDYAKYWLDPNAEHLKDKKSAGGVTAEGLLATTRPADPRAGATPAPPPPSAPAPLPSGPAAPAEPPTGDRFEAIRAEMARKQAAATSSAPADA